MLITPVRPTRTAAKASDEMHSAGSDVDHDDGKKTQEAPTAGRRKKPKDQANYCKLKIKNKNSKAKGRGFGRRR